MSIAAGRFVWYELMTPDLDAATAFYSDVVGWTARDSGMGGPPYTVLSAGETMVGGATALTDAARAAGARPGWTGYVTTDDVDATVTRVTAAGGSLRYGPDDIPTVGRFAVVADPHGAVFILFRPAGPPPDGEAHPGAAGHVGWHELHAGDREAAFGFYAQLFGWTKAEAIDMGPIGIYQLFAIGGIPVGGMMTKTADVPTPCWLYYVNVESIDAAVDRLKAAGGTVLNGPHQVPGGSWIVQGLDPQGAGFALVQPGAAH